MISGATSNNNVKDPIVIQINASLVDTEPPVENVIRRKLNKSKDWDCPILQILMKDPVVAQDGYTYERTAITEWLSKNSTSPMDRSEITNKNVYSNIGVKLLIEEYLKENPYEDKKDTELDKFLDEQIMSRQKPTTTTNHRNPYLHITHVTIPGWNVIRNALSSPSPSPRVIIIDE